MNQGKLEVFKQEMARVNISILEISELKWTGKNEETEPKEKQHPVVGVTGDGSKDQCCEEKYCIGTWSVRSMNQGQLEVANRR